MPESTRVGIITFGSMVYLHDLMAANIASSAVFRGTQEATRNDVAGLIRRGGSLESPFIAPLGTCSFAVDGVLEGLMPEVSVPVCDAFLSHVPPRFERCFANASSHTATPAARRQCKLLHNAGVPTPSPSLPSPA